MSAGRRQAPVLLLAGIGPGFGAAVATRFAAAGYAVAGLSRSTGFGQSLQTAMEREGRVYRHYACDVTQAAALAVTLEAVGRELGPPAVVIHNPMQLVIRPFLELSPEDFESAWRVICAGAMRIAQATLPAMLEAGAGTLILSGATASIKGGARFAALASAKFALRGLAQSLAREFGPRGVHVIHAVLDGLIRGPQTQARFNPAPETCIDPDAIAEVYHQLVCQPPSAWTHEVDLRPAQEKF